MVTYVSRRYAAYESPFPPTPFPACYIIRLKLHNTRRCCIYIPIAPPSVRQTAHYARTAQQDMSLGLQPSKEALAAGAVDASSTTRPAPREMEGSAALMARVGKVGLGSGYMGLVWIGRLSMDYGPSTTTTAVVAVLTLEKEVNKVVIIR